MRRCPVCDAPNPGNLSTCYSCEHTFGSTDESEDVVALATPLYEGSIATEIRERPIRSLSAFAVGLVVAALCCVLVPRQSTGETPALPARTATAVNTTPATQAPITPIVFSKLERSQLQSDVGLPYNNPIPQAPTGVSGWRNTRRAPSQSGQRVDADSGLPPTTVIGGTSPAEAARIQESYRQQHAALQALAAQTQSAGLQQQNPSLTESPQPAVRDPQPRPVRRIRIGATQRRPDRTSGSYRSELGGNPGGTASSPPFGETEASRNAIAGSLFSEKVQRYNQLLLTINIASERNVRAANNGAGIGAALSSRGNVSGRLNRSGMSEREALQISRELEVLRAEITRDPLITRFAEYGEPSNTDWPNAPRYNWRFFRPR